MGSAELFASAGVDILARLGVDTIAFGSESGDIDVLRALARKAEDYKPSNDKSIGTAADYFAALGDLKSNDILGIEYLKAGKMFAPNMNFVTVKREGAGYHDDAENGAYPSATEIRRAMLEENIEAYSEAQLPEHSKCAIREAFEEGQIALMKKVESAILFFWRTADIQSVSACAECGGGVAERLAAAAKCAGTIEEMLGFAATKRYTDARLRRAVIYGMMGVTLEDLRRRAPYVNFLGAKFEGLKFLSDVRGINVISKPSRIPDDAESKRQAELCLKFDALYTLAMNYPVDVGFFHRQSPHVIKIDNKF
jgi:predicted nucleotidyltransferase